jgi:Cdc6-like AAA superfamily ATPase
VSSCNAESTSLRADDDPSLVILDEIDSLLPPAPAVATPATSHLLSKIFSLPSKNAGRVKLVAISNTLDLTLRARLILPDNATPLVLPFKAYVGENMVDIISSRLTFAGSDEQGSGVKVDNKALVLLSRKVEAQNGDLRMYLGVISSAVTLAEMEWVKKGGNAGSKIPLTKVSLQHMIKALTNHIQQLKASAGSASTGTTTVTGKKIKSVPLQGKMVLMAILVFVSRVKAGLPGSPAQNSGSNTPVSASRTSELLTTSTLYAAYSHLLSHTSSPFPPSPESDYRDLLSNLEVLGLISLASGSNSSTMSRTGSGMSSRRGNASTAGQKIELNVRDDEIKEGLGIDGAGGKGLAEEEVAKIWEREESRIVRAKEKLSKALEAKAAEDI